MTHQGFFSILISSLQPDGYRKIRELAIRRALTYVVLLVLLGTLIKAIFAVPYAFEIAKSLGNSSSKFEIANVQDMIGTKEAILIPESRPLFQIDTSKGVEKKAPILITKDGIAYGNDASQKILSFPDFNSPQDTGVKKFLLIIAVLIAPSVIIILIIQSLLKVLLISLAMGVIAFAIGSYRRSRHTIFSSLSLALYAMSILVLIESVMVPLGWGKYLLPLFSFLGMTLYLVPLGVALCIFSIWSIISGSDKYKFD